MSQTFSVLASAAPQLITSIAQARAVRSQASYESSILETNARIQEELAADAIHRGNIEAERLKKATRRQIGAQRAALAAQGLNLEEDDALAIQQDTAEIGAEDVFDTKNNAWKTAWGYRVRAQDFRSRASLSRSAARSVSRNTILTGGLNFAQSLAYGIYSLNK